MLRGILGPEETIMNEKIQDLLKQVEVRGGNVHLSPQLPDALAESFLRQVLDCPDCAQNTGEGKQNSTTITLQTPESP